MTICQEGSKFPVYTNIKKDIKNKNGLDRSNNNSENGERCNKYCFRLLCESEQGWHESSLAICFPKMEMAAEEEFMKSVSPYTARMLAILKHSKLNLPILTGPEGEQLCRQIEEVGIYLSNYIKITMKCSPSLTYNTSSY